MPKFLIAITMMLLMSFCVSATAQDYPTRAMRFIVPFPPGGGNDVVGRIIAGKLQESMGQEVIVDNRGASGGTVGTDLVAKSPPDGHTLLINNISLAVNATLFPKLPYDTLKDLAPVSVIGQQPSVLLISPNLQAQTVRETLQLARARAGQFIYGSGGPGSSAHLATERLMLSSKTRMTHVPYKGLAQAVADLAAGRLDMVIATTSPALPMVKEAKVRALAVTTAKRSAQFPQLPTMIEAGVQGYEVSTWYALLMAGRTPQRFISRINTELGRIAANPEVKDRFAAQGLETGHTTPAQARAHIQSEIAKWRPVVKASGIKAE